MLIAQLTEIQKSYGAHTVLEGVHWQIADGARAALVGRNGAGKTTLFRLLLGDLEPDRGTVWFRKGAVVAAMEQEVRIEDRRTLREEAARGLRHLEELHEEFGEVTARLGAVTEGDPGTQDLLDRYAHLQERLEREGGYSFEARVQAVLTGLHFAEEDLDRPLAEFSGGQKSRAILARVLLRDPDLLLLDEPTNHLDLDAIEWLENFLQNYQGAFVVVSHDRMFLNRVTDRTAELRHRKLHHFHGNYDGFLVERERRLEEQARHYELQRAEISRQEDFIRRNIAGQKTKQAQARRKMLEKLERVEPPEWPASSIRMEIPEPERSARNVVEARRAAKRYGETTIFSEASFLILRGQKVGLVGPNGVGKSTLVRLLVGEESPTSGRLKIGPGVRIGYYEQEQTGIRGPQSVLDEVWKVTPQVTENEIRNFLGSFLFRGDEVFKALNQLSGGEKSRVALAMLVREGANFLVLDEPTNHLDIESREVFEAALRAFGGTVLVVSHDRYFLDRVVDHVMELRADGCHLWEGGYSAYARARVRAPVPEAPAPAAPPAAAESRLPETRPAGRQRAGRDPVPPPAPPAAKEERRRGYEAERRRKRDEAALRRRVADAEARVEELEGRRESLVLSMSDPEVAVDPGRLARLSGDLRELEAGIRAAIAEWERLSVRLEGFLDLDN